MDAVALAAGEVANLLVLLRPAEVERRDVRAAVAQLAADIDLVLAIADLFEERLRRRERVARLRNVGELHRLADLQRAAIRLLLASDETEQRGLAGAVRTDHADDAATWQLERE